MFTIVDLIGFIILFSTILLTIAIIYARWNYGKLERLNIPVVKPSFCLGSEPNLHNLILPYEDMKNQKKYGNIWGIYEGRNPQVLVTDAEMIKQIFVKDFAHFYNRRHEDEFGLGDAIIDPETELNGEKWKVVRQHIMTPAFTTGRMKYMSQFMKESIAEFVIDLKEEINNTPDGKIKGKEYDLKSLLSSLTTDIIARCAFGTKVSSLKDPNNLFMANAKKLVLADYTPDIFFTLLVCFPHLAKFINLMDKKAHGFFVAILKNIIQERKTKNERIHDYVDLILDFEKNLETDEYKRLTITDRTLYAQGMTFIVAGYETSSLTMTTLAYHLSMNPSIQNKLQYEIDEMLNDENGRIDSETANNLPYLMACINEALRICPAILRLDRSCTQDWTYGNIHIPKGQLVQVPLFALHHHPDYYDDPEAFNPERFMPENKDKINPYAFMPFGLGPRNCVGFRFGYEQIRLIFVNLLKDFSFVATKDTEFTLKPGFIFLTQMNPVQISLVPRETVNNED